MIKNKKSKKEKIYNIPNPLTITRIILSPFLVYLALIGSSIWTITIIFIMAAITDFLDGFFARKLKQETHFGRKLDIIADRILMISLVVTIFIYLNINNLRTNTNIQFILLLMTREILCAPSFLMALIKNTRSIPHARFMGKLTTTLQGFGVPFVILMWPGAVYIVTAAAIAGLVGACYYAYDSLINPNNKFQKRMDKHYDSLYK